MKSFELEKQEYMDCLINYINVLTALSHNKKELSTLEIILDPKNEDELKFAKATLQFYSDGEKVIKDAFSGNLEKIDLDNSILVRMLVDILNIVKSGDESKLSDLSKMFTEDDGSMLANFTYEYIVATVIQQDEMLDAISKKIDIDFNNELDLLRFSVSMQKLKALADVRDQSDDKTFAMKIYDKFHQLYLKNKNTGSNDLQVPKK